MHLTPDDVLWVAKFVKLLCGITLDDTKGYLIESRLSSLAKEFDCKDYRQLCQAANAGNRALRTRIIDAITTQETLFFRDNSPFEALENKAIPELIDVKAKTAFPKRLRIWSAASSTGQEPYSLAMILCELIPNIQTWNINILGTDISDSAIRRASLGQYSQHEITRGMKPSMLKKYFVKEKDDWRVSDQIRSLVLFKQRNLLDSFSDLGPFDIILCRNVAIYFDADARRSLFNRLADRLTTDGYLFTGSSESLSDLGPRFAPQNHCRSVFYRPNLPTSVTNSTRS